MTDDLHRSRQIVSQAEAEEGMVDLLVAHVERAYDAGGQPGAVAAVREIFQHLDPSARTGLLFEMGLETEPPLDEMGDQR